MYIYFEFLARAIRVFVTHVLFAYTNTSWDCAE